MLCLKPIFSDHFFDKKRVFTKKVPTFTRCKNCCTKSIEITKNTHLRDAYVTQRVTRSIILVNLKLLILKSKHLLVLFTKLRATRPAGCCLVKQRKDYYLLRMCTGSQEEQARFQAQSVVLANALQVNGVDIINYQSTLW